MPTNPTTPPIQEEKLKMDPRDEQIAELNTQKSALKAENASLETSLKALKPIQEDVTDIRELLGVSADFDLVKAVKALKEQRDEMAAESSRLLEETMTAIITDKVKIEGVRAIVTDLVRSEKPVTRKQLDAAIDGVLARESVKSLLATKLQETMGDKQRRPLTPGTHDDSYKQLVNIPERK